MKSGMKLNELSSRTGASTATLKSWIREGVLPAGLLKNQTTAIYGEHHVERAALIRALREQFNPPLPEIAQLTSIIDTPDSSREDIMEACQLIATGIGSISPTASSEGSTPGQLLVDNMLAAARWPQVDSVARSAAIIAVDQALENNVALNGAAMLGYARALEDIANHDVVVVKPDGTRDAMALNILIGASTQARLVAALNQLAHTSAAIANRHRAGQLRENPLA